MGHYYAEMMCTKCGMLYCCCKPTKVKKKKKLTKKEIKLLDKPGTHTNYFATDL